MGANVFGLIWYAVRFTRGQNVPGPSRRIRGILSSRQGSLGLHTYPNGVWIFWISNVNERQLNNTHVLAQIRLMKDCWRSSRCFWLWREKEKTDPLLERQEMEMHKSKGYFIMAVNLCFSKLLIAHFSTLLREIDEIPQCSFRLRLALESNPARNQSESVINDLKVNTERYVTS